MPDTIRIGKHIIGRGEPIYIVAEIGINHNGNITIAKKMIDTAKKCGVDAVKFQVFHAEEFVTDETSTYTYLSQGKEITEPMIKLFKRYEFSPKEWKELFDYCKTKKIDFFASPQNISDLELILSITKVPVIKVGADDLTNVGLLAYYAAKKIPMMISAGMAYLSEIEDAVEAIRKTGNNDIIILHCVSCYPADAEEINLKKMQTIEKAFDVIVGYSDHALGSTAAVGAAVMGASVIEKHFTLDKEMPGPDHWFSATPDEFTDLIRRVRYIEKAMGRTVIVPTPREMEMRAIARRSIVASKNIRKNEVITEKCIELKRPGTGLPPKFFRYIPGKKAKTNIRRNEQITFENIY
jgi:sialic acid synthase SpsE